MLRKNRFKTARLVYLDLVTSGPAIGARIARKVPVSVHPDPFEVCRCNFC